MSYHLHFVSPPLSQFIECLWYVDLRIPYPREKILPTGTVELMINFGAPFRLYDDVGQSTLQTDSWLVGLQSHAILHEPLAETHMLGIRFKPAGAYPFFQLPASEVHNQIVSLDNLWGRAAAELRDCLLEAPSIAARFYLTENWLVSHLIDIPYEFKTINYAVTELAKTQGSRSIHALSEQIGISHKHLISQFKRVVGVSPKMLARIYRFQSALQMIGSAENVSWSAAALDAKYYDQSHFNHDFAAFTGLTPSEYLRQRQIMAELAGDNLHFLPTS